MQPWFITGKQKYRKAMDSHIVLPKICIKLKNSDIYITPHSNWNKTKYYVMVLPTPPQKNPQKNINKNLETLEKKIGLMHAYKIRYRPIFNPFIENHDCT